MNFICSNGRIKSVETIAKHLYTEQQHNASKKHCRSYYTYEIEGVTDRKVLKTYILNYHKALENSYVDYEKEIENDEFFELNSKVEILNKDKSSIIKYSIL